MGEVILDFLYKNIRIIYCLVVGKKIAKKRVTFKTKKPSTRQFVQKMNIRKIKHVLVISAIIFFTHKGYALEESKAKRCKGDFINPITDVCWECLFPVTIGSIELEGSDKPDTKNPSSPVCVCTKNNIPIPGITGGFWEPARMTDISAEPYCFVNLGGVKMDMGFERGSGSRPKASSGESAKVYIHYYMDPLLLMLNIFTDVICLERIGFDLFWTTELDPNSDDELSAPSS